MQQSSNMEAPSSQDHLQVELENLQINENPLETNSEEHEEEHDSEWESSSDDDDDEMIFQLKITLKDVTPKIWRRIQVPSCDTFEDLHDYIQEAMGWRCCHLHQFELPNGTVVSDDMQEFAEDPEAEDECDLKLRDVFTQVGTKVLYVYDMGDWWEHEVVLEKILEEQEDIFYPRCVGGKRACPPEDCGGAHGYMHLLKVIADPSHKEHDDLTSWLEDMYPGFNPEKFNKKKVFNTLYLDMEKFESFLNGSN